MEKLGRRGHRRMVPVQEAPTAAIGAAVRDGHVGELGDGDRRLIRVERIEGVTVPPPVADRLDRVVSRPDGGVP